MITEGKWEITKDVKQNSVYVAQIHSVDDSGVVRRLVASATRVDDARLIAAAPDLLVACKELLSDFRHYNTETMREVNSTMKQAEAAIANAESV